MTAAGLGGLLVLLQAAACSGLRALHEPAATKKVKLGGNHIMQRAVSATAVALRDAEESIAQDQTDVRQTILYVDKVKDSFGMEDSLWNGKMDQADTKMSLRLLSLFSNREFVKALDKSFKDLQLVLKHVPSLSAKRVQEVLKRKRDTPDERFIAATQFFKKETTLLGTQLNKSADILNSVLLALPKDFDVYRRLGSVMVQELAQQATNITAHFSGSEEIFCDHVKSEIEARALPILQYTKSLLPRVENFARAQAPKEVLPQASAAVAKMSALVDSLHKFFEHDVHAVVEQVCSAIRVNGVPNVVSAPPAAKQPAERHAAPAPAEAASAAPAPAEASAGSEASAAPAPAEAASRPEAGAAVGE